MKLRYLTVYNKNGLDGPKTLQYWDDETKQWLDVESIRVKYSDEVIALNYKNFPKLNNE